MVRKLGTANGVSSNLSSCLGLKRDDGVIPVQLEGWRHEKLMFQLRPKLGKVPLNMFGQEIPLTHGKSQSLFFSGLKLTGWATYINRCSYKMGLGKVPE